MAIRNIGIGLFRGTAVSLYGMLLFEVFMAWKNIKSKNTYGIPNKIKQYAKENNNIIMGK